MPEPGLPGQATIAELRAAVAVWPRRTALRDGEVKKLIRAMAAGADWATAKALLPADVDTTGVDAFQATVTTFAAMTNPPHLSP